MAATIITIAIEKGGCGKTVSTINFADLMSNEGKKVLCVDTDPQGNLTQSLTGVRITDNTFRMNGLYDRVNAFTYKETRDFISETNLEGVDIIPANSKTPRIGERIKSLLEDCKSFDDDDPAKIKGENLFLKYFLEQVREDYDYILIDTQPSRDSILVMNALSAADYILIPMKCDAYSIDSAFRTYTACNEMRKNGICASKGIGLMLTIVEKGLAHDIVRNNVEEVMGSILFDTEIRAGKAVSTSTLAGVPVVEYARTQPVAKSYVAAYEELKRRLGDSENDKGVE